MKILYAVQGTGNGHITRARVMAKAFAMRGDVDVDFIFSGRDKDKYFDMQVFGNYRTLQGLTFVTSDGAINYWKTIKSLKLRQCIRDINLLDLGGYDLLLNDFEPVTAWAAKRQGIPSISISHQAAFCHAIPHQEMRTTDKLVNRYFAPTDIQLGVHWYHFGFPILPPFIDVQSSEIILDKSILIYLPFEEINAIQQTLQSCEEFDFVSFHPSVQKVYTQGNIVWHPIAKMTFGKALSQCQGVIANAGFELASECLQLKKRMLLKPLLGQFEQVSNAHTLSALGLCRLMKTLEIDVIKSWLQSDTPETIHFSSDPNTLIDWLLKKQWEDTQGLCASLWREVRYPPNVMLQLSQLYD
ncbi:MAG: hypothetical protein ACI936_001070 [Paraglaciecola sp.]|jgi:uncharacterized protein (TIGR00661 family)